MKNLGMSIQQAPSSGFRVSPCGDSLSPLTISECPPWLEEDGSRRDTLYLIPSNTERAADFTEEVGRVQRGLVLHHYSGGRRVGEPVIVERLARPVEDKDLRYFAKYMAIEFGYDGAEAAGQDAAWYRSRVGEDVCTLGQAHRLRWETVSRCRQSDSDDQQARELMLMTKNRPERDRLLDMTVLMMAVLALFVLAFCYQHQRTVSEEQRFDARYGLQVDAKGGR